MQAVSISLGASCAYVAVAQVTPANTQWCALPSINVIANSAGNRRTPVVAALMEETLFGENALQVYPRHPHKVVPYIFSYAAAAAALCDALHSRDKVKETAARLLLKVVEEASQTKYASHCSLTEERAAEGTRVGRYRLGFYYDSEKGGEVRSAFVSAEDLFIEFLNYVKEHVVEGACGLNTSAGESGDLNNAGKSIVLTLVVPRYCFPGMTCGHGGIGRSGSLEWLREAVGASSLGGVCAHFSIIFSDEGALLGMDSVAARTQLPYFLLPPNTAAPHQCQEELIPAAIAEATVLVVDWGVHALTCSVLKTRGGLLVLKDGDRSCTTPLLCATMQGAPLEGGEGCFFATHRACGGDAVDVALADRVATHYLLQNRRMFAACVGDVQALQQTQRNLLELRNDPGASAKVIETCIPARALRRLRLLMEEKKIALNVNLQANSVSVEMEAFYEGMDLHDKQTFTRNKFELALSRDWSVVDMFHSILEELAQRFEYYLKANPITHVILVGGMCNIPAIAQALRKAVEQPAVQAAGGCFVLPSVQVLHASSLGSSLGADELPAVGGCLNSFHSALIALRRAEMSAVCSKKKGVKAKGVDFVAAREAGDALLQIWTSLVWEDNEEEEVDGINSRTRARMLRRSVYAFVGDNLASHLDTAASHDPLLLPKRLLHCLFPDGTLLPHRVVIPWATSRCPALLYLFSEARAREDWASHDNSYLPVRPVHPKGILISPQSAETGKDSAGTSSLVFTLDTRQDEDGDEQLRLSVLLVRHTGDRLPYLITPHNAQECAEVFLL